MTILWDIRMQAPEALDEETSAFLSDLAATGHGRTSISFTATTALNSLMTAN